MPSARIPWTVALALLVAALTACQGNIGQRLRSTSRTGATGPTVRLTDADLSPVDRYVASGSGGSNSRWILGDVVDVVASREYFAQVLTLNRTSLVEGKETTEGDDRVVTMRFVGHPSQLSAQTNPRIQIGTGLTVTARKVLRLRLTRTVNPDVPVVLHIRANGKAVVGHKEQILRRAPSLDMGGRLVRRGNAWTWVPVSGV